MEVIRMLIAEGLIIVPMILVMRRVTIIMTMIIAISTLIIITHRYNDDKEQEFTWTNIENKTGKNDFSK